MIFSIFRVHKSYPGFPIVFDQILYTIQTSFRQALHKFYRAFDQNREEYYARLLALSRDNDWDGWIDFFLRGVEHQAHENAGKAKKIIALYSAKKTDIPDILRSKYSVRVIDALFIRPIFTIHDFVTDSGIPYESGQKIIGTLKKNSVISVRKEGRGRSPSVYEFSDLLAII